MSKYDSYSAWAFMSVIRLMLCMSWIASGILLSIAVITGWLEEHILGWMMEDLNSAGMFVLGGVISAMGLMLLSSNIKDIRAEYRLLKQYFG